MNRLMMSHELLARYSQTISQLKTKSSNKTWWNTTTEFLSYISLYRLLSQELPFFFKSFCGWPEFCFFSWLFSSPQDSVFAVGHLVGWGVEQVTEAHAAHGSQCSDCTNASNAQNVVRFLTLLDTFWHFLTLLDRLTILTYSDADRWMAHLLQGHAGDFQEQKRLWWDWTKGSGTALLKYLHWSFFKMVSMCLLTCQSNDNDTSICAVMRLSCPVLHKPGNTGPPCLAASDKNLLTSVGLLDRRLQVVSPCFSMFLHILTVAVLRNPADRKTL